MSYEFLGLFAHAQKDHLAVPNWTQIGNISHIAGLIIIACHLVRLIIHITVLLADVLLNLCMYYVYYYIIIIIPLLLIQLGIFHLLIYIPLYSLTDRFLFRLPNRIFDLTLSDQWFFTNTTKPAINRFHK